MPAHRRSSMRTDTRRSPSVFRCQGSDETRRRAKASQAPADPIARHVAQAQKFRRLAWGQRHLDVVERHGQAVANGLDDGFLARPAIEESEWPVARFERCVDLALAPGKCPRRDIVGLAQRTDRLDVDADFAATGKGIHGDVLAVRYVEMQTAAGERRLA